MARRGPPQDLIKTRQLRAQIDPSHVIPENTRDDHVDGDLIDELSALKSHGPSTAVSIPVPGDTPSSDDLGALSDPAVDDLSPLIEKLEVEAQTATSARRSAVLLYEIGRLYETQRLDPARALASYRRSYDRYPGLIANLRALGRLLADTGDFTTCIRVLEAEINAVPTSAERAAILTHRAILRQHHLDDVEGARQDLQRVLDIDPDDPVALDLLAEIYERFGRLDLAEKLLSRRIRRYDDPAVRSMFLSEIARLRELGGTKGTNIIAAYRNALNIDPTNTHALRSLLRTARESGDYPAVAKLSQTLAAFEPPAVAAATLWDAARLYAGYLRNTDLAIESLQEASRRMPADLALLTDLATLLERERRWEELAATLAQARDASDNDEAGALLAYRLARIHVERLSDVPGAIKALEDALKVSPTLGPARAMLGRLYARHEHWTKLVALLHEEIQQTQDPDRLAAIWYRIGDIYEKRVDDLKEACLSYEASLATLPAYRPAVRALSRVYRRLERWEDLVAIYEHELQSVTDREERILILRRISEIWERDLSDPVAALPAYERLLAIVPSHLPALQALHHIYAAGNRWNDLVDILRTEADQTMDRWRHITILNEIATVQETQLDSADDALTTYLEVLSYAPTYQPALMATGRLLTARGDYERLLEIHRQELNNCEDPSHRSWLLVNIGRILSEHLDRPGDAAETFREALQIADRSAAADLLIHLYERVGDDRQLAQVLATLALPDDPPARARYHRRIAEALIRSDRPPLAIEHLQRALATSDDDAARDELVRLYEAIGDRQSLLALYQRQAKSAANIDLALEPLHKIAQLWASADHDLHHAAKTYESILSRSPRDPIVLRQLEVILTRLGDWESLTSVIALESEPSVDPDYRTACALTIAAFEEHRLGHLALAAQASVEVLERAPTNPEALATLERHARQTSNSERLLQVFSRHLRRAQTVAEQAATLCATAAVHANRGEFDDALELYRMAAEQAKSYLPAPRGWLRAAQQRNLPEDIALALESEARSLIRPAGRAQCDLTAAKYWRKLGHDDRACDALQRVLEIEPTRVDAVKLLHAIYKETQRYQDLSDLYEHQIRNTKDLQEKRDLLIRKADVQRRHLQDILGARHTTNRALDIFPDDPQVLSTLAELCRTSEDWRALAKVNQRLASRISDPALAKAIHFELGRLWEEHLGNPRRAIAEYREVLEFDESDLAALSRLANLLFEQESWADAVDVTEHLVRRDDDRGRVKNYHLRLAQIYADGLHDIDAGMRCCRRALAMDPGDLEGTNRLAELLERKGDARGLHAHVESCLTVHRARLDRDPFAVSSYEALESVFSRQGQRDRLHVVRSILAGIGVMDRGTRDALDALRRQAPSESSRPLTDDELHLLILHPMERGPLFEVLNLAKPILRKIHGHAEHNEPRGTKITARSRPELSSIIRQIAKNLGAGRFDAFVIPGGIDQLRVEDTAPPSLFIGEDLDEVPLTKLRFRLAQAIASLRLGHGLPYRLGAEGLGHTLAALLSATCSTYTPTVPENRIRDIGERITKALGRRLRARLEPLALEFVDRPFAPERWIASMRQSEDRAALTITGDVVAAIEFLASQFHRQGPRSLDLADLADAAGPRLREILVFVVSEEFLTLRERLGLAL